MNINLKDAKTTVLGIQGSGKTILAKELIKQFKHPLIYGVHLYEWQQAKDNVVVYNPFDYSLETFNSFAGDLINGIKSRNYNYDALVVDEADMFFRTNFNINKNINDLFINNRHYGLAIIFVTRRPQDISTKIYEQSEHIFIFAIEGVNVKMRLENLHEQMKALLPQLHKDKHNFIYKRIGENPIIFKGIELK